MKRGVNSGKKERGRIVTAPIVYVLFILFFIFLPYGASAQEGRGYLDISGGYKTGDFGTPTTSDLWYFSPTVGYVTPRYDFSVTLPYLSLRNETGGVSSTESGIGDIIIRGGAVLLPEGSGGLSVNGSLALKLPTADETKGLGTGETDYGAFLALHQRLDQFKFSLMGGYIKVGDPPQTTFNDIFLYGVGISRVLGRTNLSASFEGRRAIVAGEKNPQEINLGFFHVLNEDYAIKGGTFFGLNDGGPGFGLNAGIVKWF